MGHQFEIHPLLAIFAVMIGWEIGGLVGIYTFGTAHRGDTRDLAPVCPFQFRAATRTCAGPHRDG
jgi:hypothetical protein